MTTPVHKSQARWYSKLHIQIFSAMIVGVVLGLAIGDPAVWALGWMGTVFMQALRMVIVPLVLASLTSGVASIGTGRELGRIGAKTLGYYALTSFLAIFVGLFFVNLIRPGVGAQIAGVEPLALPEIARPAGPGELALRLLLDLIPANPLQAMAEGQMLGVIGFAILMGIAIAHAPAGVRDAGRRAFGGFFEIMMVLTSLVIRLAPLGVLGLMTQAAAQSGVAAFVPLGKYVLTLGSGLLTHGLITLPLVLLILGRIDPRIHYRNMAAALGMAFSTASSGATLPLTMRCVQEKVGVSNRVASFVIPMGATVNMDGTALFECVAVIFIAQVLGVPLGAAQQATIVVTAFAASVGAAAIPNAGLVMIFIVLEAVGLQGPQAGLIVGTMLAIDRPLDMLRTTVNVLSDSCGAAIIARSEGETDVNIGRGSRSAPARPICGRRRRPPRAVRAGCKLQDSPERHHGVSPVERLAGACGYHNRHGGTRDAVESRGNALGRQYEALRATACDEEEGSRVGQQSTAGRLPVGSGHRRDDRPPLGAIQREEDTPQAQRSLCGPVLAGR